MNANRNPEEPPPSTGKDAPAASLAELVFVALERLEGEGTDAIDDLCAANPEQADDLRRRIDQLRLSGLIEDAPGLPIEPPTMVGAYRLGDVLGEGGMGIVVAAVEEPLGRDVAIKLIRPEYLGSDVARRRFEREVMATARLQHPGIVRVFAVGEAEGLPYFAMERIAGCTLAEALRSLAGRDPHRLTGADLAGAIAECSRGGGGEAWRDDAPRGDVAPIFRCSWSDAAARIVREVAEAVAFAHAAGVVHRDLKPSNVMITPGGRVVLLDFGLAHWLDGEALTRTGAYVGSLPYTAPELIEQDRPSSPASDVYSLGVMLYQILSLQLPFQAASHSALIAAIVDARPPPIRSYHRGVTWELQAVAGCAMEPSPARRIPSATALAHDLTNAIEGRPIEASRPRFAGAIQRWIRRNPLTAAASAIVLVASTVIPPAILHVRAEAAAAVARQGARSHASLDRALDAVDRLRDAVQAEPVVDIKSAAALRRSLLERASDFYSAIVDEGRRTGADQGRHAILRARLGWVESLAALGEVAKAARVLRELRAARPTEFQDRIELAAAAISARRGDPRATAAAARTGLTHRSVEDPMTEARLWWRLAVAESARDGRDAEQALRACIAAAERVPRDDPMRWEHAQTLAATAEIRLAEAEDDATAAAEVLDRARERLGRALDSAIDAVPLELTLADADGRRARVAMDALRTASAAEFADRAARRWRRMSAAFPGSPEVVERRQAAVAERDVIRSLDSGEEAQSHADESTAR